MSAIDQQKAAIRAEKLAHLRSLTSNERSRLSAEILQQLQAAEIWRNARSVLIYHPLKSEPDVRPLLAEARQQILLPRVTPEGLDIHRFTSTDSLLHSSFGTFEPDPERCPRITLDEIDLAIIPGVAFDPCTRVRLGRGGGYYDRLLANPKFSATTIGIAFDLQLHEGLPSEPHDQAVDHLLTENGLR